jgi:hypothetical protein
MSKKRRRNSLDFLYDSFTDRYGKLDPKALTAFISFLILVLSWYFNMFFNFTTNELLIEIFAFLVFGLLGLKVVPWGKKDATIINNEENLKEEENEKPVN